MDNVDGVQVELRWPNDSNHEKIYGLINSVTQVASSDGNVVGIIYEEMADYFNGNKTADEVVGLIQNRVSTYLNEVS